MLTRLLAAAFPAVVIMGALLVLGQAALALADLVGPTREAVAEVVDRDRTERTRTDDDGREETRVAYATTFAIGEDRTTVEGQALYSGLATGLEVDVLVTPLTGRIQQVTWDGTVRYERPPDLFALLVAPSALLVAGVVLRRRWPELRAHLAQADR